MRNILIIVLVLFSCAIKAQDVDVVENCGNAVYQNSKGQVYENYHDAKVVIDLKNSKVSITVADFVTDYKVKKVDFWNTDTLILKCKGDKNTDWVHVYYRVDGYSVLLHYNEDLEVLLTRA